MATVEDRDETVRYISISTLFAKESGLVYRGLTLVLLNPDVYAAFANSVDPDQLASSEAN